MSLVSVITPTYNSSAFIIETLESIFYQHWEDIELIITDDHSSDDTVKICRGWLNNHSSRFIRTELLTTNINTGVSGNANRGLRKASGEWIKYIGSDDALMPDCLYSNMDYIARNPEVKVLFSRIDIYHEVFMPDNYIMTTPDGELTSESILWSQRTAESQYRMLLLSDRIHFSPSVFINRDVLISIGGFDERFELLEDYPLWLNLTKNGIKLHFMDNVTVKYRRHGNALNNTGESYLVDPNFLKQESFRRTYTYPHLPLIIRINQQYKWHLSQWYLWFLSKRNNHLNRAIIKILTVYFNPLTYVIWLKAHLLRRSDDIEFYS